VIAGKEGHYCVTIGPEDSQDCGGDRRAGSPILRLYQDIRVLGRREFLSIEPLVRPRQDEHRAITPKQWAESLPRLTEKAFAAKDTAELFGS